MSYNPFRLVYGRGMMPGLPGRRSFRGRFIDHVRGIDRDGVRRIGFPAGFEKEARRSKVVGNDFPDDTDLIDAFHEIP